MSWTFYVTLFSPSGCRVSEQNTSWQTKFASNCQLWGKALLILAYVHTMHVCPGQLCKPMKTQGKDKRAVQLGMSQRGRGSPIVPPTIGASSCPQVCSLCCSAHKRACFLLPSLAEGFTAVSSLLRQWPLAFNFSGAFQLSIFCWYLFFYIYVFFIALLSHGRVL